MNRRGTPGRVAFSDLESWQHTLGRFAEATGLTVVLYDAKGKLLVPSLPSNPLSALLISRGGWRQGGLCRTDGKKVALQSIQTGKTAHAEGCGGLSIIAIPVHAPDGVAGAVVAGWVFTNYPEPVSTDRFARELDMPFPELWQVVRQVAPVSHSKLLLYGELLGIIAQLFVAHHADRSERSGLISHLQTQQTELERAARARDEFLAVVSHELRTPLTPIQGWIPLIREYLDKGQLDLAREGLDVIERNARQETHLIDEMLDLSRILVDRIVFSPERVSVTETIREIAGVAHTFCGDRKLSIATETADGLPEIIVDRKRLLQSLANLVSNAVKFTPDGGRITIGARNGSGSVEFFVSDTGIGLNAKAVNLIFDRFKQAEAGITRRFGGLGIGLSVVRGLVEMQGGRAWAESAGEGLGSTFFLSFPVAPDSQHVIEVKPVSDAEPELPVPALGKSELRKRREATRLLIVDDVPDTLNLMRRLLERAGFRVTITGSAEAALESAALSPPDILLTDLGMPDCDGMELLSRMRANGSLHDLPAIALTGFTGEADRQKAVEAGFDAYFTKPLDIPALLETLDCLLHTRSQRGAEDSR